MTEIFLGEGMYSVSDDGEVFSYVSGRRHSMVLSPGGGALGKYLTVNLRVGDKRKTYSVHRLVAAAFVPNPDNKPCVNHIDGNPTNNAASNLEWVTQRGNAQHAHRHSLVRPRLCIVCGREKYGHNGTCRLCATRGGSKGKPH